jgi:hypothetical protein
MEKSVAPRLVGKIPGNTKYPALLAFSGMQAIVEYLPGDWETSRAAWSLINVLKSDEVGFKIIGVSLNPEIRAEGVTIFTCEPEMDITSLPSPAIVDRQELALAFEKQREADERRSLEESRCRRAGIAISDFLESWGWLGVERRSTFPKELPLNTIKISIGYKPSPYFLPPEMKQMMELMNQEEQMEKELEREIPPSDQP